MRFIAFADTHTSLFLHRKIVAYTKEYNVDFLICAGDMTLYGNYWQESLEELQKADVPMIFVPGNHEYKRDIIQKIEKYSFVKNIDEKVHLIEDVAIIGLGASDFPLEKNIAADFVIRKLNTIQVKNKINKIFVSHIPPENTTTACPINRQDAGSTRVAKWLVDIDPSILLCGHIHRPVARKCIVNNTTIYNIACECHLFEITSKTVQWLQKLDFKIC